MGKHEVHMQPWRCHRLQAMRIGQAFSRVLHPDGEVLFHDADTPLDPLLEEAWHPLCLPHGPQTPDQVRSPPP